MKVYICVITTVLLYNHSLKFAVVFEQICKYSAYDYVREPGSLFIRKESFEDKYTCDF